MDEQTMSQPQSQQQKQEANMSVFQSLQGSLEQEATLRETIRDSVREFDTNVRSLTAHLNSIHAIPSSEFGRLAGDAERFLPACRSNVESLAALVPTDQYYRYSDMWTRSIQSFSFDVVLTHWLQTGELLSAQAAGQAMGVKPEWNDHFKLTTEDYLHSVVTLVNELARLCPNSIVNSDFALPLKISRFCKEIHAGFGLLNLKNDSLRKRFDGMKYDIKKMEEVVYDISLRGLVPSAAGDAASNKRARGDDLA